MDPVKIAFEPKVRIIPLDQILPSRMLSATIIGSAKYARIAASLAEVGLVEPLVIAHAKAGNAFPLLDGHVRLSILKDQGVSTARCVVSCDDEAFTYNKRVNRLATIQEHYMIVRAIERGVSEEKLARALNADIAATRGRMMRKMRCLALPRLRSTQQVKIVGSENLTAFGTPRTGPVIAG